MRNERKKPKSDLRKYYTIFFEVGLVLVLLIFIVAMRVEWRNTGENMDLTDEQEVVDMEEVIQTEQEEKPPPPPRPQVPVEVPNDEVIEDQDINLDADMELDERLEPPSPPSDGEGEGEGDEDDFFVAVEQDPQLVGSLQDLQDKIEYPEKARRAGIEGQVIVQFIVDTDGEIEDPQVIRSVHPLLDKAAVEGIQNHAKFKPGQQRGNPVRVQFSLPIIFRLGNM